ncbi:hypothetical protein DB347_08620 [Opitutaceae bacterium EW11]|nr:hypothetical protein DB347_08620 [Opitutaceae bacterium EW11]
MRLYVVVTGVVFALILAAHGLRLGAEGAALLREPSFVLTSLLCAALVVWAVVLIRRSKR